MIPRIVHQTWRNAAVPEALGAYAETWRRHHPSWSYRLWTDADLVNLVENRFPDLADTFHGYPQAIMRADLGRYLVLKAHGGVYADLDAEALRPWDGLLDAERPQFFEEPASHAAREFVGRRGFSRIVSNAVIATPTDHPFWDHFLALLRRCRNARSPLDATGPFVLTAAVQSAPAAIAPDVRPAYLAARRDSEGADVPGTGADAAEAALADHHWAGTWWRGGDRNWPPGHGKDPRKTPWYDRLRERRAERRLAASVAAARTLSPDTSLPRGQRILVAVPVGSGAQPIDRFLDALEALDHPKEATSLAFLASTGDGIGRVRAFARERSSRYATMAVHRCRLASDLPDRGTPLGERAARAHLARMRNRLLRRSLGDQDWVLWLDPDTVGLPLDLIGSLIGAAARVVQPNAVAAPGGRTVDTQCWLSETELDEEAMRPYLLNGLYLPPVGYARLYPSDLRYRDRMPLDSVGGTALLVDADLHRAGILFPETPYRHLIDTEGFGAILRDHGVAIAGLPNLEVIRAGS